MKKQLKMEGYKAQGEALGLCPGDGSDDGNEGEPTTPPGGGKK